MKKQLIALLVAGAVAPMLLSISAYAAVYPTRVVTKMEKKQTLKETLKTKAKKMGLSAKLTGEITAISGNTLSVKQGDKSYTVNVGDSTKLYRRFGAKATLSEFAVGNKINIVGTWTDESKIAINASYIRDVSVMKKFGTFVGKVTSKSDGSFVIEPKVRQTQTIMVSSTTKYTDRNKNAITYADIAVGDRVQTRGVWDKSNKKVIETSEVRDLTLPKKSGK